MTRRDLLIQATAAGAYFNRGQYRLFAKSSAQYSARTIELVERSLVIDMLGLLTLDWDRLQSWQHQPASFSAGDAARFRQSGINVFHPAVELTGPDPFTAAHQCLSDWDSLFRLHPEGFTAIRNISDLAGVKRSGRTGVLLGMQNSAHFRTLADVDLFYTLGQRISQLTYNSENRLGCGCLDQHDRGLTPFGAAVIARMNLLGMAVDVSHTGDRTTLDAIAASRAPVLITHSNCRALRAHPRCKSDAAIRAMAATGGVIGITALRPFVRATSTVTIEDALDHFDHAIKLVGVEHVGIGSDTGLERRDRSSRGPGLQLDIRGLDHTRRIYDLTAGLIRRRYSDASIGAILGGNIARALASAWQPASLPKLEVSQVTSSLFHSLSC